MLQFITVLAVALGAFFAGYAVSAKTGARLLLRALWRRGSLIIYPSGNDMVVKTVVDQVQDASSGSGSLRSGTFELRPGEGYQVKVRPKPGDLVRLVIDLEHSDGQVLVFSKLEILTRFGEKRFIEKD